MNAATEHVRVTCPNCGSGSIGHSARYIVRAPCLSWRRDPETGAPRPTSWGDNEILRATIEALELPFDCLNCHEDGLTEDDLVVTAEPPRAKPEALTIAYVAIGAHEAWRAASEAQREAVADGYGGQLGFIDACTGHALLLDRAWDAAAGDGVTFAYDVAEPFGEALAKALLAGGIDPAIPDPDPATIIADLIGGVDLATIRSLA